MADRIVALIGTGEGPWVYTGNMVQPELEVSGEHDPGEVQVLFAHRPCYNELTLLETGRRYAKVHYKGPNKRLICRITDKAQNAKSCN